MTGALRFDNTTLLKRDVGSESTWMAMHIFEFSHFLVFAGMKTEQKAM
jgi:hypothetical protein